MTTPETKLSQINQLIQDISPWQDKFVHEIDQLQDIKHNLDSKLKRFSQQQQTLNIAIMGQVKAGKSSFLNALLFDGKPILPEAATPKTANLTRISYADTPKLEVDFYSPKDWQNIENLAKTDSNSQAVKVAKEQVAMIQQAGIEPLAIIGQGTFIQQADTLDDIMHLLNDYAGNDGKYTALVKMIRLYLPLDELSGYNIIDTPGMNDPVVSRTQRTKEEMANCDVVFFLSRASNFLDSTDTDLLSEQLPNAGIKRLILVAGQYDSAIEQDGYDRDSLTATEQNLQNRINKRANDDISKLAERKRQAGQEPVANMLQQLTQPIFSSTYAFGFANWDKSLWNAGMSHAYNELCELAEDEWDYQFTQEDWQRIAGFTSLIDAYQQARQDKANIIAQQKNALLPDTQHQLDTWSQEFIEHLDKRISNIKNNDIAQLNAQQKHYEHQIHNISQALEDILGNAISKAQKTQQDISHSLQKEIQQRNKISTRTGTTTEEYSYEVSTSTWYKPWTWGDTETRWRTRTINYEYVSVSEAVEQVTNYAYDCIADIEYHFATIINKNQITAELRTSLYKLLASDNTEFDPKQFRTILNQAINQLDIPSLSLNIGNAGDRISSHFSSTEITSSSEREHLKQQLNQALQDTYQRLNKECQNKINLIIQSLESIKYNLADNLTESIKDEMAQQRADLENQTQALHSYQKLQSLIKTAI